MVKVKLFMYCFLFMSTFSIVAMNQLVKIPQYQFKYLRIGEGLPYYARKCISSSVGSTEPSTRVIDGEEVPVSGLPAAVLNRIKAIAEHNVYLKRMKAKREFIFEKERGEVAESFPGSLWLYQPPFDDTDDEDPKAHSPKFRKRPEEQDQSQKVVTESNQTIHSTEQIIAKKKIEEEFKMCSLCSILRDAASHDMSNIF
jgi:hypothetical protein